MASDPRDCSLGVLVEQALGPLPDHLAGSGSSLSPETRALANWYRLVLLLAAADSEFPNIKEDPELGKAATILWERMTLWHRQSFRILYEWWTASYQEPGVSLNGILQIVDRSAKLDHESKALRPEAWQYLLRLLELKRWPVGDIRGPVEVEHLEYNERVLYLFRSEFADGDDPAMDDSMNGGRRRTTRSQAAQYAYCQQLSWELFHHGSQHDSTSTLTDADVSEAVKLTRSSDCANANVLERLWQNEDPFASVAVKGPIIEACPWLEKHEKDSEDLPFYLWDVANEKTVETSRLDLSSYPKYTAISHTWGRWVIGQPVHIEGVPWKVPENAKFQVQDLPKLLKNVPGRNPYVWLDLLCIPQDGSLIGAKEISRQARIFNSARYVVAWHNEVESFDGLRSILEWKALHLLRFQAQADEDRRLTRIERAWDNIAWKQSGLLKPRSGKLDWASLELNPWYTSLWTLQEVSLRPDLWICSKDWNFLSLDGNTPLPFSGFVALDEIFWQGNPDKQRFPLSLKAEEQSHVSLFELGFWRFETGLSKVLGLDQVSLFTLGDRRECKERRGEAIMSALGVTTWYDNALSRVEEEGGSAEDFFAQSERSLVLNKYPISLVQELSVKVPGDFFAAFLRANFDPQREILSLLVSPGSMLPFSETKSYFTPAGGFRINNFQIKADTHPSVRKWEIYQTGQVHIPEAFIIFSTMAASSVPQASVIPVRMAVGGSGLVPAHEAPLPKDFRSIHGDVGMNFTDVRWANFSLWMSSQQEETYAIVVQYQRASFWMACSGLIIKRHSEGFLFKSDVFFLIDENFVIDVSTTEVTDLLIN